MKIDPNLIAEHAALGYDKNKFELQLTYAGRTVTCPLPKTPNRMIAALYRLRDELAAHVAAELSKVEAKEE